MKKAVIIVAGGSGSRMKSELPKQFINWCGMPILMHTILRFVEYDNEMDIVLVLPNSQIQLWNKLCEEFQFNVKLTVAHGGGHVPAPGERCSGRDRGGTAGASAVVSVSRLPRVARPGYAARHGSCR